LNSDQPLEDIRLVGQRKRTQCYSLEIGVSP
jgi:hypothetical protein